MYSTHTGHLSRTVRCSCAWICVGMVVVVPYVRRTVTLTRELPASLQRQQWHHLGPQHLLAAWLASPAVSIARNHACLSGLRHSSGPRSHQARPAWARLRQAKQRQALLRPVSKHTQKPEVEGRARQQTHKASLSWPRGLERSRSNLCFAAPSTAPCCQEIAIAATQWQHSSPGGRVACVETCSVCGSVIKLNASCDVGHTAGRKTFLASGS